MLRIWVLPLLGVRQIDEFKDKRKRTVSELKSENMKISTEKRRGGCDVPGHLDHKSLKAGGQPEEGLICLKRNEYYT